MSDAPKSFHEGRVMLYAGDCLSVLGGLPENSVDAICTDPPYHLTSIIKRCASRGFMGKEWDGGDIAFRVETWAKLLRVLKPGGHLVAFAAPKCSHRMVVAIEDAGFEIRDGLMWVFGSGFPKSLDVSKAIDKAAGAKREVVGRSARHVSGAPEQRTEGLCGSSTFAESVGMGAFLTAPATDAARQWQGFGTALKPAYEPVCLARKPLSEKSVAANVLRWGTGAINIDGCRVGDIVETWPKSRSYAPGQIQPGGKGETQLTGAVPSGRFPANVCHDGSEEVVEAFPAVGKSHPPDNAGSSRDNKIYGADNAPRSFHPGFVDQGSAARFFYSAKADATDRAFSKHPTVKPVDLMRWLVRMVTPPGGKVLDPFSGTGTTGHAALLEGFNAILIEREAEYLADIERRMALVFAGEIERKSHAKQDSCGGLPLFGAGGAE